MDFSDIYLPLKIRKFKHCSINITGILLLTKKIYFEHLVISRKQEMGWNINPPAPAESDAPIRLRVNSERGEDEHFVRPIRIVLWGEILLW